MKQNNVFGFDIYQNTHRVAFCMFRRNSNSEVFLWNYIIEPEFQNKGYGKKILLELFVKLSLDYNVKSVITTYKQGNDIAKSVYEKVGFVQTEVIDEPDVKEVNMQIKL